LPGSWPGSTRKTGSVKGMIIRTKRVYDPVGDGDGTRILVDRIWPRGMTREKAQVDLWLKEAAPGTALRKWFAHDPPKWDEFKTRYFSELDAVPETVRKILDSASDGPITLLFSSRDTRLNQAVALKEFPENLDRVAKSPIRDLTLPGKGKTSFSLSSRIKDLQPGSLIRAPRAGRVDDFLRSHQL